MVSAAGVAHYLLRYDWGVSLANASQVAKNSGIKLPTLFPSGANPYLLANGGVTPYSKPAGTVAASGGSTGFAPPKATTPFTPPAGLEDQFKTYLSGDTTLQGQLEALGKIDPSTGLYSGARGQALQDFLNSAKGAEISYGSVPNLGNLPISLYDPAQQGALTSALTSADQVAKVGNATTNPFSTTAQIAQALQKNNAASDANLVARGLINSGAQGQHQAENVGVSDLDSYNALQNFLGNLSSGYSKYTDQLSSFDDKQYGYQSDALNRVIALINAGILGGKSGGGGGSVDQSPGPPSVTGGGGPGSGSGSIYTSSGSIPTPLELQQAIAQHPNSAQVARNQGSPLNPPVTLLPNNPPKLPAVAAPYRITKNAVNIRSL